MFYSLIFEFRFGEEPFASKIMALEPNCIVFMPGVWAGGGGGGLKHFRFLWLQGVISELQFFYSKL